MTGLRQALLVVGIGILFRTDSAAEDLPQYPVDFAVLKADLIVEGPITGERIVTVEKVHFGAAKAGDEISVDRLKGLASAAYEKYDFPRDDSDKGISTEGQNAVLFLVRHKDGTTYEAFGWGSGVKWLLDGKVYGYEQRFNPGPYSLLPDRDSPTPDALRRAIAAGLKKRREYEMTLLESDQETKAEKLSRYLQPAEPSHYFHGALKELQTLGRAGAIVFRRELDRQEQSRRRVEILYAFGRTKDKDSLPFLMSVVNDARRAVVDTDSYFDDAQADEKERNAVADWLAAIFAISEIGDAAEYLPQFREAAVWGAKHRSHLLMEYAVRGMGKAPVEANLPTFREIFELLPKANKGFGRHAAHVPVDILIKHQSRDAVPLLASQLDHPNPDIGNSAHEGLKKIVGRDLGATEEPWLNWYAENRKK